MQHLFATQGPANVRQSYLILGGLWALLMSTAFSVQAGPVFQYKDESGRTVFSDRQPAVQPNVTVMDYQPRAEKQEKLRVFPRKTEVGYELVIANDYFAPVEVLISSSMFPGGRQRQVVGPASTTVVYQSPKKLAGFESRWVIGDPAAQADNTPYRVPAQSKVGYRVTQSFNGRFSHQREPNIYAVDIAMDIGTYLTAARAGTVIDVKDDYHMSGTDSYFLDKANYVKVLHDDGTYGVYAHIHMDSAQVSPGDRVSTGQKLARSGSNGYSTGPHLHFVIWKNGGNGRTVSVPFQFVDSKGLTYQPMAGMRVMGVSQ